MANADFNNGFNACLDTYLEALEKGNQDDTTIVDGDGNNNNLKLPNMPKDFEQAQGQQSQQGSDKNDDQQGSDKNGSQQTGDKQSGGKLPLKGLPTGKLLSPSEMDDIRNRVKNDKTISQDLKNAIDETIASNTIINNESSRNEKIGDFKRRLSSKSKIAAEFLDGILEASAKYANLWKKILKGFVSSNATFAKLPSTEIRWGQRKGLALGQMKPYELKKDKQPQIINICIDTSGSINIELLEEFASAIASLAKSKLYSGINIIPWDTIVYETIPVETKHGNLFEELKKSINMAKSAGGGGTDIEDLCSCIVGDAREKKKDIYIIISDGECSTAPLKKIPSDIMKRCVAIIYNNNNLVFSDWMQYFDNKHFASIKL